MLTSPNILSSILGQQQPIKRQGIDIQSLLNVPAPMASNAILGTPSVGKPSMSSDIMGYVPSFQPSTPYSATNLPEFMQGYEQTPSGRFVMSQGLLGMAPDVANVQSLFSKQYGQEYDPLEQQFQESFALDPSLFGNIYRAGGMIPGVPRGMTADTSSGLGGLAGVLAGGAALKALTPLTDNIASSVSMGDVKSGTGIGGWFQENFNKPEFINTAQEKAKEYIKKFKETDFYKSGKTALDLGGDAFSTYGRIENLINNPNPMNAFKAIDAMDKLTTYLPESAQQSLQEVTASIGPATGIALDALGVASIVNAFENPSAQNIANAYGGLDYLAQQGYMGTNLSTGLPYAQNIAGIGNIIGGLQALEGGIEGPGEALQVATGAATAASMFGGGTAIGSAGTATLPVLGPIAALYGAYEILNKPEANLGHAIVGRDSYGGYSIESEGYKGQGESIAKPEANAAMLVLGELERNYGYKFDADAWEKVNKRVDFDNGRWVRGAHDVIIDALQQGALIPTENTPQSLDFGSMLKDARFYMSEAPYTTNKSMSSFARGQERARQMQASEAYGPEGPHPLEVERMKMGLDIFQINADVNEALGRLDFSGLDFSALGIPQTTLASQPAPPPEEYIELDGKKYKLSEFRKEFGNVSLMPDIFAGFTAPNYGLLSQPANIAPVAPQVAQPVTQPAQVASYSPMSPGYDFSQIRF
jgi:hypothetical protein